MDKPIPCPFCESWDVIRYSYKFSNNIHYQCSKCGCHFIFDNKSKDIWNTRPIEDAKDREIERLKAELENALLILKQIDWLYSEENEEARMWELKIDGLSPTEWMCDVVQKTREFIANIPDMNDATKESEVEDE